MGRLLRRLRRGARGRRAGAREPPPPRATAPRSPVRLCPPGAAAARGAAAAARARPSHARPSLLRCFGRSCPPAPTADGRIRAAPRPGNARGNALGTNAAPPSELALTGHSWADQGGWVTVTVPLPRPHPTRSGGGSHPQPAPSPAASAPHRVSASFWEDGFSVTAVDGAGQAHALRFERLGGAIDPARCSHAAAPGPAVLLRLHKAAGAAAAPWARLGAAVAPPARPVVTARRGRAAALCGRAFARRRSFP